MVVAAGPGGFSDNSPLYRLPEQVTLPELLYTRPDGILIKGLDGKKYYNPGRVLENWIKPTKPAFYRIS